MASFSGERPERGIPLPPSQPQEGGKTVGSVVSKVQFSTVHQERDISVDSDEEDEFEDVEKSEGGMSSKGGGLQETGLTSSTQSASHQSSADVNDDLIEEHEEEGPIVPHNLSEEDEEKLLAIAAQESDGEEELREAVASVEGQQGEDEQMDTESSKQAAE